MVGFNFAAAGTSGQRAGQAGDATMGQVNSIQQYRANQKLAELMQQIAAQKNGQAPGATPQMPGSAFLPSGVSPQGGGSPPAGIAPGGAGPAGPMGGAMPPTAGAMPGGFPGAAPGGATPPTSIDPSQLAMAVQKLGLSGTEQGMLMQNYMKMMQPQQKLNTQIYGIDQRVGAENNRTNMTADTADKNRQSRNDQANARLGAMSNNDLIKEYTSTGNALRSLPADDPRYQTMLDSFNGLKTELDTRRGKAGLPSTKGAPKTTDKGASGQPGEGVDLPTFATPADKGFAELPSGAQFKTSDGQIMVKQ